MRRRHLHLLADGVRLALLGLCGVAAATAAVWNWRPQWVEAVDDWMQHRRFDGVRARLAAAEAESDPARCDRGYLTLLDELAGLHRQDHLGDVVSTCLRRLSEAALRRDDLAAALRWGERWARFDDRDLEALSNLGELESRVPERRQAGLERLAKLAWQTEGDVTPVGALTRVLLRSGQPAAAAAALDTATQCLRSNLWMLAWDAGDGIDVNRRRVDTVPVREGDETVFRFEVTEPIVGLSLWIPHLRAGLLRDLRLECGGCCCSIVFTAANTAATSAVADGGRFLVFGFGGSALTAHWDAAIPAGTPLALRFREERLPQLAYRDVLTDPDLCAWLDAQPASDAGLLRRLRDGRLLVAAARGWQAFWSCGGAGFVEDRSSRRASVPERVSGGWLVHLRLPVDGEVDRLRLDLPVGVGVRYRLPRCALETDAGTTVLDLTSAAFLSPNAVVREDGWFVVQGDDPYFVVELPAAMRVRAVEIEGIAR